RRLTGANLGDGHYPNDYQGWGEPNLIDVTFPAAPLELALFDAPDASVQPFDAPGDPSWVFVFPALAGTPVSATLAWTDEPGSTAGGKKLIDDLDLVLRSPDGSQQFLGNVFDPVAGASITGGSADTLNNVERVIVASPAAGSWRAVVRATDGDFAAPQGF